MDTHVVSLKQKFISKKNQRQNQVRVEAFNYNSGLQQQQQQQRHHQQLPSDRTERPQQKQLTHWSRFTKDSSVDLKLTAQQQEAGPTQRQKQQQQQHQKASESDEEKQRQAQAAQWIQSNMRRKSTLPFYPSLERYEIIKKLGE
ncbi:unnamed protein product [Absidia cylindrospora]